MQNGSYSGAKLAGIAVGNGCSGSEIGVCGPDGDHYRTEFLLEHAFMSRCGALLCFLVVRSYKSNQSSSALCLGPQRTRSGRRATGRKLHSPSSARSCWTRCTRPSGISICTTCMGHVSVALARRRTKTTLTLGTPRLLKHRLVRSPRRPGRGLGRPVRTPASTLSLRPSTSTETRCRLRSTSRSHQSAGQLAVQLLAGATSALERTFRVIHVRLGSCCRGVFD